MLVRPPWNLPDAPTLADPARACNLFDAEDWAVVRKDYEAGESTRLVAQRHAVGERTVRRRALEGWARRPRGQ